MTELMERHGLDVELPALGARRPAVLTVELHIEVMHGITNGPGVSHRQGRLAEAVSVGREEDELTTVVDRLAA